MKRPKRANIEITSSETKAAFIARILRSFGDLSATKAKKIGVAPGGSIITNRVTNDWTAKVRALTFMLLPPFVYRQEIQVFPIALGWFEILQAG
jgi:hypothetical protein